MWDQIMFSQGLFSGKIKPGYLTEKKSFSMFTADI